MDPHARILVVDRNRYNLELLVQFLNRRGYEAVTAASFEEFDVALHDINRLALALVDLTGFDPGIWQRCDRLRVAGIPFVMLSLAGRSQTVQQAGAMHGAQGVLIKPLQSETLVDLIRNLLAS